jgi:hypothetical protein
MIALLPRPPRVPTSARSCRINHVPHCPPRHRSRTIHRVHSKKVHDRFILLAECSEDVLREQTTHDGQCRGEERGGMFCKVAAAT